MHKMAALSLRSSRVLRRMSFDFALVGYSETVTQLIRGRDISQVTTSPSKIFESSERFCSNYLNSTD